MITWRDLYIYDDTGSRCGTLGRYMEDAIKDHEPYGIDTMRLEIAEGKAVIAEWPQHFLAAENEEPSAYSPEAPVDWAGFREEYEKAIMRSIEMYNEVLITPCASGFGEYELSEANGESWDDINDLEAAIRDAVNLIDWDEIEGTELDISGRIHGESNLIRKYAWRDDAGDVHYCGII